MTPHLAWEKGGEATLLSLNGEAVRLVSTRPFPPGARIEGRLLSGEEEKVRVKVHGCKRREDGAFVIEGRALDLTRRLREMVAALPLP